LWFSFSGKHSFQEFFGLFFGDISQRPAVSFEAVAQDPPTDGFNRRNNPAKNNLFIGEKIDIRGPFQ